jgi:GNAT superfamily N-acetyltransferase
MIRRAHKQDRDAFLGLWREMLVENYGIGGEILPSESNVEFYGRLFDAYVTEQFQGAILLSVGDDAIPNGCLLWGDSGPGQVETRWGRIAMGWGTYVRPEFRRRGISTDLRCEGRALLREMGFDTVLGSAVETNEAGIRSGLDRGGFRLHGIVGVIDLRVSE